MKRVVKYSVCFMAFIMVVFTFVACSKGRDKIETGNYYLNGDTSQQYVKIYEGEQLALMNFDGLAFAQAINPQSEEVTDEQYQELVAPIINGMNQKISYWYDEDFFEYNFSFPGFEDMFITPFAYSATEDSPVITLVEQEYILVK